MGASKQLLTSKEFANRSGLPVSKITKLLRDGSLKGQKKGGKWMISASELDAFQTPQASAAQPSPPPKTKTTGATAPSAPAARSAQGYTVAEFSALTYLTEFGVRDWLKKGRLKGDQTKNGEWRIDAANLEASHIKRLVR